MANPYQMVNWPELGGLNENRDPDAIPPHDLIFSHNEAGRDSATGTRPGFVYETAGDYTGQIAGTPVIQGMTEFNRTQDFSREFMVVVAGGLLYEDSSTQITKGTAVITSGKDLLWAFATHQDYLWATGGADTDPMWYWDGAGNATALLLNDGTGPATEHPKYILPKWGRLYVAGMNPGTPTNSYNRINVRYSEIGVDLTLGTIAEWPTGYTIGTGANVGDVGGLAAYGNEYITGLAEYIDSTGDWMVIGTNHALYFVERMADLRHFISSATPTGLVNQHAWVTLGVDAGDAIYMSQYGIHSLRQSREFGAKEDEFLSYKIRDTFDNLRRDRFSVVSGAYDAREGYVVFLATGPNAAAGAAAMHDTVLCLDTRGNEVTNALTGRRRLTLTADTAKWHVWELAGGVNANLVQVVRDQDGKPRLYAGTNTGEVGHLSRTLYSDWGASYAVRFQTAHASFGAPHLDKSAGDIVVDAQPGGAWSPAVRRFFNFGTAAGPSHPIVMTDIHESLLNGSDVLGPSAGAQLFILGGFGMDTARRRICGSGHGSTIGLEFSHSGGNQPFFIANVGQEIGGLGDTPSFGSGDE